MSERVLDGIGRARGGLDDLLPDGLSASSLTDAELRVEIVDGASGPAGSGRGFVANPVLDGTYTMAVARYARRGTSA